MGTFFALNIFVFKGVNDSVAFLGGDNLFWGRKKHLFIIYLDLKKKSLKHFLDFHVLKKNRFILHKP